MGVWPDRGRRAASLPLREEGAGGYMGAVCRCRDVSETGELYGKIRGLGWIPSAMEEARVVVVRMER